MDKKLSENLVEVVKDLFERAGFNASQVSIDSIESKEENHEDNSEVYLVKVASEDDCSMLLGKYGENLKSFEHIARAVAQKKLDQKFSLSVDINGYREQRSKRVVEIARQVAERVRATQKAEALFPMSSYERRLVHVELVSEKDILTESIGEEPKRRVVIRPCL
ncbi:MAG: hypothetical protein HYW77_02240 [Parcubacteria group bacterium]|nr:hypothetical protein [Parcubacteria group bacterium]